MSEPTRDGPVGSLVDDLFRRQYGRLVAGLTRVFGPARLDLVEDMVQEALMRALRRWPYEGIPREPEAWLVQVARNLALDALRRRAMADRKLAELERWAASAVDPVATEPKEVADDTLRLIFTCCHPALSCESRVALTLKTLCGLGVPEIARALLAKDATVAQRLTRAKAQLQREQVAFEVPSSDDLDGRLDSVLEVLYLLFNEGYAAAQGEDLVRLELVREAIRLADLLLSMPRTAQPRVHALFALFLFQAARVPARQDGDGALLTLAQQDRSRWDRRVLAAAWHHFERSMSGAEVTAYHLEAAIASAHAAAPTYAQTDWPTILRRYDQLAALVATPIVRLNRAVAVAKVHGAAAGLAELDALVARGQLADYHLLHATRAQFQWSGGDRAGAMASFAAAQACACSLPERRLLEQRERACRTGEAAPDL